MRGVFMNGKVPFDQPVPGHCLEERESKTTATATRRSKSLARFPEHEPGPASCGGPWGRWTDCRCVALIDVGGDGAVNTLATGRGSGGQLPLLAGMAIALGQARWRQPSK